MGARVTQGDGRPVRAGPALVRVLVFPLSFVLGLGFVGVVVERDRRALHDIVAGAIVVYDSGDRVTSA